MSGRQPRVLLHVQHLLGSGHTRRVAAIARALVDAGAEVLMASGGMALPSLDTGGARLLQLPPLRSADASYTLLLDADGKPVNDAWRQERAACLLTAADAFAPDVLLVETFPFGRRMLRFELLPLIESLRARSPRVRMHCSVRDVLEPPRKPGRAEQTVALIESCFDGVFVHADASVVTLGHSFPLADAIADRVHYTGYVIDDDDAPVGTANEGEDEVLVSAGGGPVGAELLECALAARVLSVSTNRRWRLLVAPGVAPAIFESLRARAPRGVIVERNRDDFRALLSRCRVSVSQAGYNTLVEALKAGARVVAVPYAAAGEQEQGLRARLLRSAGLVRSLVAERLSPAALAALVDEAANDIRPAAHFACDGAATTARALLADLFDSRAARGCNGHERPI